MKVKKSDDRFIQALKKISDDRIRNFCECLKMAIVALEKQIPKTPDQEGDGYADGKLVYDTWICPCCGERYEIGYDRYKYCPNCGQRVDMEDEVG